MHRVIRVDQKIDCMRINKRVTSISSGKHIQCDIVPYLEMHRRGA